MVQHTLVVRNLTNAGVKSQLAKELGDANKITNISFKNKNPTKKIKYALVTVESENKETKDLVSLLDKKNVDGKELKVTVAKAPHERASHLARVARLKKFEKFSTTWPPRKYHNIANQDPATNTAFRLPAKNGRPTRVSKVLPAKKIQKNKSVKSRALHLTKVPTTVTKKQILESLKEHGATKGRFSHQGKKTSSGLVFFKTAEARAKALEALKKAQGLKIGEHTIGARTAHKTSNQTSFEKRQRKPAAAAPAKTPAQ